MVSIRLTQEEENLLTALSHAHNKKKSQILKDALHFYAHQLSQPPSPYALGEDLFGRYQSDEDLSATYKQRLKTQLNAKHPR